jgi:hypothetical protein
VLTFERLADLGDSTTHLAIAFAQRSEQKRMELDLIGGKDKHGHAASPLHFAGTRENAGGAGADNLIGTGYAAERSYQFAGAGGMLNGEESDADIGVGNTRLRHRLSRGFFRRPFRRNVTRLSDTGSKHLNSTIGSL